MSFGVGIIGCGLIGQKRAKALGEGRLIACADINEGCAKVLAGKSKAKVFRNWRDLLALPEVDIVIIATLHDSLAEITQASIEAGKHVLVEKPAARNPAELAPVMAADRRGVKVRVGFNHRYHDSVLDALEIIDSGRLGNVINMRGVYGKSKFISFGQHSDWRVDRAVAGGGILLDQGIHMVDLMRLFAGEFTDVKSFVSNDFWGHDVEDNVYAMMRSKSGCVAMLHSTATQWRHRFSLEIALDKGGLVLSGILSGSKSYGAETLTIIDADDDDQGDPKEATSQYDDDHSWASEITEFADALLRGGDIKSGTSGDALSTMQLVERIYKADADWARRWDL